MSNPIVHASLFRVPKAPMSQWIYWDRKVPNWLQQQNQRSSWLHQLSNDSSVTPRSAGAWALWWALMVVTITLCWLLPQTSTIHSSTRMMAGSAGSGRQTFLLSSGSWFPWWRTLPSFFSFKSLWMSGRLPTPHQALTVCESALAGWLASFGQPSELPYRKPFQQDQKGWLRDREALAL